MADDFDAWLAEGIAKGWCAEPVCASHDTMWTPEELAASDDGEDLLDACLVAVRLRPADTRAEPWPPKESPPV